jgi:hypothetical protein
MGTRWSQSRRASPADGHSTAAMTARYTGEIPLAQVRAAFSIGNGNKIDVLENVENDRPIRDVA